MKKETKDAIIGIILGLIGGMVLAAILNYYWYKKKGLCPWCGNEINPHH